MDDAGDAYVCTVAGGREKADQRITLCRQSESNATRCVVLALETPDDFEHRIDALVVPEPGVVVLRAGGELSRFELPE